MNTFDLLMHGLEVAIQPINLLYALIGVTLGTAVGVWRTSGTRDAARIARVEGPVLGRSSVTARCYTGRPEAPVRGVGARYLSGSPTGRSA